MIFYNNAHDTVHDVVHFAIEYFMIFYDNAYDTVHDVVHFTIPIFSVFTFFFSTFILISTLVLYGMIYYLTLCI